MRMNSQSGSSLWFMNHTFLNHEVMNLDSKANWDAFCRDGKWLPVALSEVVATILEKSSLVSLRPYMKPGSICSKMALVDTSGYCNKCREVMAMFWMG